MTRLALVTALLTAAVACKGDDTEPADSGADNCGDTSGEYPPVVGDWAGQFALEYYSDDCDVAGLEQSEMTWLTSAYDIGGYAPEGLRLEIAGEDFELSGTVGKNGVLGFVGTRDSPYGTMTVTLTGFTYEDTRMGRWVWKGSAFVGVDKDDDGSIDCDIRGDFSATQSGA